MTERIKAVANHLLGSSQTSDNSDAWTGVPQAPPDAIFQLTASYKQDSFKQKVNLGVGAYRDNEGKPWVLPSVKQAQEALIMDATVDHEYLPITGQPEFTTSAASLILSPSSPAIKESRISSCQTISGTGANHLGAVFLSKFYDFNKAGGKKQIFISNPTWGNHKAIFKSAGIEPVDYPYYDPKAIALDFEGFKSSILSAPNNSVFLLHPCAHNPTGVDPTKNQWSEIADLFQQKGHFAFFDCAYQGFASGDLDTDAAAIRMFVDRAKIPMLVCQSFAKNAGLYGERAGCLHVISVNQERAKAVLSQLSVIQRSEISNPPAFGARVVAKLLNEPRLFEMWKGDVKTMSHRIIEMRKRLFELLTNELKTPGSWDHVTKQIGMFCFSGLNKAQSQAMIEKHHIYLTGDGRISMAGLNTHNIEYVAKAIDDVVRNVK